MSLEEYVKAAKTDSDILRELNTLAMRSRISRLEALHARTMMEVADLCEKMNQWQDAFLYRAYTEHLYGNLYDIHKQVGLNTPPVAVDRKRLEDVLTTPWSGDNYSNRIWNNGRKFERDIRSTIMESIHRGTSTQILAKNLSQNVSEKFLDDVTKNIKNVSKKLAARKRVAYNCAERLIRTELNYIENRAAGDAMKDADMPFYQFIAVHDHRTTPTCQSLDGRYFPVEEMNQGENAPPMHVRCRSTIIAALDDGTSGRAKGTRTSRDDKGKRIKIPADMNYKDWKKVYIDKTQTLDDWKKSKFDFKTEIKDLQKTFASQKANGATATELEKTIKSAGRLVVDEVKKANIVQSVDINKINKEVDIAREAWRNARGWEEKQRARKLYDEAWEKYNRAREQNEKLPMLRAGQMKNLLAQARQMGATREHFKKQFGTSRSKVRGLFENALNCYPSEWVEKSVNRGILEPQIPRKRRAFYFDSRSIIAANENDFTAAIHELGHRMEHTLSDIHDACTEFYSRRTAGEQPKKLKDLFPNSEYDDWEITRKDKFLDMYMGKDYGGRAYELVSMGFEYAYTDPMKLLRDKDMAEWIFGLLVIV